MMSDKQPFYWLDKNTLFTGSSCTEDRYRSHIRDENNAQSRHAGKGAGSARAC